VVQETEGTEEAASPDLSDADILLWFGDFNYRIDVSYEQALSLIEKKRYDVLLLKDQLRNEMSSGRTFHGMREGFVGFAPTYKFDHGSQGILSLRLRLFFVEEAVISLQKYLPSPLYDAQ